MSKCKLSRDARMFFGVEIRNVSGVQPATLGSAYDSHQQAPMDVMKSWCCYDDFYPLVETKEMIDDLGVELRRLIRKYGKRQSLETLLF